MKQITFPKNTHEVSGHKVTALKSTIIRPGRDAGGRMPRSCKCGCESSSHLRAAASQLVTFASRRAGILVGRQELLIWGATKSFKLGLQLDPKLLSQPRHPLWAG